MWNQKKRRNYAINTFNCALFLHQSFPALGSVAALIISEHGERFFCCWRSSTIRRWKLENEVDDLMEEMWSERAASRLTFFSLSIWNTPVSRCCKKMKLNSCVNEYFRNQNFHSGLVRISSSSFLPSLPSLPALTPLRSARVCSSLKVSWRRL